jgi:HAMP domain-containing protein
MSAELDQMKKIMEGMVSKALLQAAEDEVRSLKGEVDGLQRRLKAEQDRHGNAIEDMVTRSDLDHAQDQAKLLTAEVARLQNLIKLMVPKAELDSAKDEISARSEEIARLRRLMESMVPVKQLDAAQDKNLSLKQELEALRGTLSTMSSKADFEEAVADVNRLKAEVERLQKSIEDMVPKKQLDGVHAEVRALESQLEALKRQRTVLESERNKLYARIIPAPPIFNVPGGRPYQDGLQVTLTSDDPEVLMYYTLDGSEPGPQNYERSGRSSLQVTLSEPGVVKAVSVSENAKASPVVAEEFKEVKRPKPVATPPKSNDVGGIGMLIKCLLDSGVVVVEDLTAGEPAILSGRIRIGDRLLVVNGVEVTPQNFEQVSAMIPGPSGTRVDLQLVQGTAASLASDPAHLRAAGVVYSVSLIRSVFGQKPVATRTSFS